MTAPVQTDWYPNRGDFKTHAEYNASRQAFDRIYDLQRKVAGMAGGGAAGKTGGATAAPTLGDSGPSTSQIAGLNVTATPPAHGQSPTYNAATGEWTPATAAGGVAPPVSSSAPGVPGQIAFDGTHLYVCITSGTWMRAALTTF